MSEEELLTYSVTVTVIAILSFIIAMSNTAARLRLDKRCTTLETVIDTYIAERNANQIKIRDCNSKIVSLTNELEYTKYQLESKGYSVQTISKYANGATINMILPQVTNSIDYQNKPTDNG